MRVLSLALLAAATLSHAQVPDACPPALPQPLPLAAAEARIESCNREVRAAMLAIAAAQADVLIAGQRPNPTLSLTMNNWSPSKGLGAGGVRDKQLDQALHLEQLMERGGKLELRIAQAQANVAAARADLAEQERQ